MIDKSCSFWKILTSGGYIETSDSTQALLTTPAYRFFLTDHLGSVRVVADAAGNVLQRNDYLPYGEDYIATYAPGGDILAGLNIPLIIEEDDDEEEENLEGGNRFGEIDEGDEEDPGDEVVGVIGPEYYRSFNAYRFSGKEQVRGLYDFGARWFTPKRAHWTTMDPLAEKYYSISPYVYCAGNPVNLVDPSGMADFWHNGRIIGNDGVNDNKVYVLKTREQFFINGDHTIPGAGLSKNSEKEALSFIKKNSGNSEAFANSGIYNSFIEIEGSQSIREAMLSIVKQDDGKGGKKESNNREYGGSITDNSVEEAEPGKVGSPIEGASVVISSKSGDSTFHSHASGDLYDAETKTEYTYSQPPSIYDIKTFNKGTHYVFGMRDNNVYVYNAEGVQAVIPQKYFVTPK